MTGNQRIDPAQPRRILVVGSGGREHALCWRLSRDPGVERVLVAPGNALMSDVAAIRPVSASDHAALVELAVAERVDLVVIGPEAPLAAGVADLLRAAGIAVFGPGAAPARIEASKSFCRDVARAAGIPIARGGVYDALGPALDAVRRMGGSVVVKADGLAAGKGVTVCRTEEEAETALRAALVEGIFGSAGSRVVIEEVLEGPELSVIALCDGRTAVPLPAARDHKRLGEDDRGPNTGGMGAFAPVPDLSPADVRSLVTRFHEPCLRELASRGTPFIGALYAGLMLTVHGPRLLEFNARFGDPEAQAILPLLEGSLGAALLSAARSHLDAGPVRAGTGEASVAVVLAAAGYPGEPSTGATIGGLDAPRSDGALIFGGAITERDGDLVTNGGRVLTVVGRGPDVREAAAAAYAAAERIHFPGMQMRRDIGASRLIGAGVSA